MLRSSLTSFIVIATLLWSATTHGQTRQIDEVGPYVRHVERHFRELTATGTDTYGPDTTAMWMSVVDTRTGLPPEEPHAPKRVYRQIGAPQGTTLYWDQPLVVAACELSRLTGKPEYEESAARYINAFLDRCVDQRGMFEWGNHKRTKDEVFHEGIRRWAKIVSDQTPANGEKGAYAEHYGRCIHFLVRAGHVLKDENMIAQAHVLAKEAVDRLHDGRLFQGYPETHSYESVDGVGYLFLAPMYLETGQELHLRGFGF